MNQKVRKILKIVTGILFVIVIGVYAYSVTPKTFQNDTFYTIKIGELIEQTTESPVDLLPWNKGLDMQDHFSFHNLPYTYPHWLYDFLTYQFFKVGSFEALYYVTCILAIILGISVYFVNVKLSGRRFLSFLVTLGTIYFLKDFITARAQLVTFILFVFTIFGIEKFIDKGKLRYSLLLLIIPVLIANLHCAVWPFYFVLFMPYVAEFAVVSIVTADYRAIFAKIKLFIKRHFGKNKLSQSQIDDEIKAIELLRKEHEKMIAYRKEKTYKISIEKNKYSKFLIGIIIIAIFSGLLTPIKDTPYTYLIKTSEGNTTQNINEHLPLTLAKNEDMVVVLILTLGILIFTRTKIKLRDLFMLTGLFVLTFMSQRQFSMLVLIGNFIFTRLSGNVLDSISAFFEKNVNRAVNAFKECYLDVVTSVVIIVCVVAASFVNYAGEKGKKYVNEKSYPVEAVNYIKESIIPNVGVENFRLYNEYNYGSYILFSDIPVFIDSRADLYTPEFNGQKNKDGKYVGNDIFSDFLDISNLSVDYEEKFEEYDITHVITISNSKLSSLIDKDNNYSLIYSDSSFKIYERENVNE